MHQQQTVVYEDSSRGFSVGKHKFELNSQELFDSVSTWSHVYFAT